MVLKAAGQSESLDNKEKRERDVIQRKQFLFKYLTSFLLALAKHLAVGLDLSYYSPQSWAASSFTRCNSMEQLAWWGNSRSWA